MEAKFSVNMATLFLTFYGPRRKRICNYTPQERVEEANKGDQQRIYYMASKKTKQQQNQSLM